MKPGITHDGSRQNLIGDAASVELEFGTSAHEHVSSKTPPVFLFHTANDGTVPVQNSLLYAGQMAMYGRPFELLVLPDGPHGIGMAFDDEKLSWTGELERWLKGIVGG